MGRITGQDALGKFQVIVDDCPVCGFKDGYCVRWKDTPKVDDYVKNARSFLLRVKNYASTRLHRQVGINCGCYAKVHRQMVHINGGKK